MSLRSGYRWRATSQIWYLFDSGGIDIGENFAVLELAESRSARQSAPSRKQMAILNKVDFAVGIGGENGQGIASTGDILARIFARRGSI